MTFSPDYKVKGSLNTGSTGRNVRLVFPGVRGEIKKPLKVAENVALAAGTKVIIQPLNRHLPQETPRFKLTVYERAASKHEDLPEDQRNIVTKASYEVELSKPLRFLDYTEEQYQRSHDDLFQEGSPCIDDINQYRVPNCFFLAALSKIVHHPKGPAYIRSMMRQNDDGTTTVRLFNPKTLEPIYVRLENSYIVDQSGSLNTHKALWVHVLEKAYASIPELLDKNDASMSSVYSNGGFERTALAVLTGLGVDSNRIVQESFQAWDVPNYFQNEVVQIEPLMEIADQLPHLEAIIKGTLTGKLKVFKELFGEEEGLLRCKELFNFYLKHKGEWTKCVTTETESTQQLANIVTMVNDYLLKQPQEGSDLDLNRVKDTLTQMFVYYFVPVNTNVVRGDREIFSGNYSPSDLQHFERIKAALEEGKLVTAGTLHDFKDVQGIRAKHAYAVLDVIEKQVPVANKEQTKTVYFVRLRNPWGSTGRLYLPDPDTMEIKVEESREATIFDLELKDFCRYYSNYDITATPTSLFSLAAQKEILSEQVAQTLKAWNITSESNHYDLAAALDEYRKHVDSLVSIELSQLDLLDENQLASFEDILNDSLIDSEEEKRQKIIEQINPNRFPHLQGNEAQIKSYLYEVLVYRWRQANNRLTQEQIAEFEGKIIGNACRYHAEWAQLLDKYQHLYVLTTENIKNVLFNVKDVACSLMATMKEYGDQMPSEDSEMRSYCLQAYLLNYRLLEDYLKGFFEYQALSNRLHFSAFDANEVEAFNTQVKEIIEKTEAILDAQDAKEIHATLCHEPCETDRWQPDSEKKRGIQEKLEILGLEVKEYRPADEKEREEKARLLQFLHSMKNLFASLANSLKKLFQKPQRDYEKEATGPKNDKDKLKSPGRSGLFSVETSKEANGELKSPHVTASPAA